MDNLFPYHKAAIWALVSALVSAEQLQAAEPTIPLGYQPDRYERVWKKSPFTVASVIEVKPADTSSFTDNLSLVGLVTIGGKPLVTLRTVDSQQDQLVDSEKPNAEGLQVVSFVNNLDPAKVEVVLKKGESSGTLRFVINETAPQQPVAAGNTQPRIINNVPQPLPRPAIGQPPIRSTTINQPIFRRRPLTLPGSNRAGAPPPPRPSNNRGAVIPPP